MSSKAPHGEFSNIELYGLKREHKIGDSFVFKRIDIIGLVFGTFKKDALICEHFIYAVYPIFVGLGASLKDNTAVDLALPEFSGSDFFNHFRSPLILLLVCCRLLSPRLL